MRKREVIELRYRIDCVGWLCPPNGHQQGTFVNARMGKHTGVKERGIPDIVIFHIPGRPGQLRRGKKLR